MLKPCWQARCACHPAARADLAMPQTLDDLAGQQAIVPLVADIETLALVGTQFEDALITTRNAAAVISRRGGYARTQSLENDFKVNARRANVRFARGVGLSLLRCGTEPTPVSLVAVDCTGAVQHQVQCVSEPDHQMADALIAGEVTQPVGPDVVRPLNVVPLNAIRKKRHAWDRSTAADHVNDLLIDRGRTRYDCLPHLGRDSAWRAAVPFFAKWLQCLCERGANVTRIVCASGLLQAQGGPVTGAAVNGHIITMDQPNGGFALDLSQIAALWVTASRLHWQLEAYDAQGRAIAAFCAPPLSCGPDWREALLSLPRIG